MSQQINNVRLNLDSIICISKIRSKKQQTQNNESIELFEEAFDYAKALGDQKYAMNCLCNLGIMEGGREFDLFAQNFVIPGTVDFESPHDDDKNYGMLVKSSQKHAVVRPGHGNSNISGEDK